MKQDKMEPEDRAVCVCSHFPLIPRQHVNLIIDKKEKTGREEGRGRVNREEKRGEGGDEGGESDRHCVFSQFLVTSRLLGNCCRSNSRQCDLR